MAKIHNQVPTVPSDDESFKVKKEEEVEKTDVRKIRGPDGQPIYLTKENVTKIYGKHEASKIELFEQLQKTFTSEQVPLRL